MASLSGSNPHHWQAPSPPPASPTRSQVKLNRKLNMCHCRRRSLPQTAAVPVAAALSAERSLVLPLCPPGPLAVAVRHCQWQCGTAALAVAVLPGQCPVPLPVTASTGTGPLPLLAVAQPLLTLATASDSGCDQAFTGTLAPARQCQCIMSACHQAGRLKYFLVAKEPRYNGTIYI